MLYDGGDRNKSSFVVSYLKQHGVTELDYMIASHYDADHINGLVGALNTTVVNQVLGPDYTTDTRVFNSFQNTIASKGIPKEQPAVGTSTSWDLLQKSTPAYAVLSCGADNSYGHPHVESMEKLQAMEIELLRTDKQGTIIVSTDGSTITWNVSPCNDYSPGSDDDLPAQPVTQASTQVTETNDSAISVSTEYILNTSSKKIHDPNCNSVSKMKE